MYKVTEMVIDSFTQEIEVSNHAIEFRFHYIDVHGSGEWGVHQIEPNLHAITCNALKSSG